MLHFKLETCQKCFFNLSNCCNLYSGQQGAGKLGLWKHIRQIKPARKPSQGTASNMTQAQESTSLNYVNKETDDIDGSHQLNRLWQISSYLHVKLNLSADNMTCDKTQNVFHIVWNIKLVENCCIHSFTYYPKFYYTVKFVGSSTSSLFTLPSTSTRIFSFDWNFIVLCTSLK